MSRRILAVVLLGVIWLTVAQASAAVDTSNYSDVILLRNGGIVKGTIYLQPDSRKTGIVNRSGLKIEIPTKQIRLITKRNSDFESIHRQILDSLAKANPPRLPVIRIGLWRAGVSAGSRVTTASMTGMMAFESHHGQVVGVGAGYDQFSKGRFVPVFGELGFVLGAKRAWYVSAKVGYSVGWVKNWSSADFGGARFGFGLGHFGYLGKGVTLLEELGYFGQSTGVSHDWLHQVSLMLGLRFGPR